MPELPEVETMRRGILPVVGSRIEDVRWPRSRLAPIQVRPARREFRRRLCRREIVEVGRIGKRVLVWVEGDECISFEPRMTGRVLVVDPPDRLHVRVVFELAGGPVPELLFWNMRGLGVVRLYTARTLQEDLGPHRMGPDALEVTSEQLRTRLGRSRRAIKVALMDQRAVAGIGNIYASEILHRMKIHPATPCDRIRPRQWQLMADVTHEVLERAILLQGSTLGDGNYRNAENRPGGFQREFRVYQLEGERCLQCGRGRIRRVVQAQRSTFFCPCCQRAGRATGPREN